MDIGLFVSNVPRTAVIDSQEITLHATHQEAAETEFMRLMRYDDGAYIVNSAGARAAPTGPHRRLLLRYIDESGNTLSEFTASIPVEHSGAVSIRAWMLGIPSRQLSSIDMVSDSVSTVWERGADTLECVAFTYGIDTLYVATAGVIFRPGQIWNDLLNRADTLSVANNQDSAMTVGRLALANAEAEYGVEDTVVAHVIHHLGLYSFRKGRFKTCDSIWKRALSIYEKVHGPNHLDVAIELNAMGSALLSRSKYAEAEALYRRALAIRKSILGPEHVNVAKLLANIALLYNRQGKFVEAEAFYEPAVAIIEKAYGPNHPSTLQARNNLAVLYMDQAKYDEARAVFEQILATFEETDRAETRDAAAAIQNLAIISNKQGRYDEAEVLHRRTLAIKEKVMDVDHPSVAETLNSLVDICTRQHRWDEAEPMIRRVDAIWAKIYGPKHPASAKALYSKAMLYHWQGKYDEADSLYRHALGIWIEAFGDNHSSVAAGHKAYSRLCRERKNYERALEEASRACEIRRQNFLDNSAVLSETDALNYAQLQRASADNYLSCYLEAEPTDSHTVNAAANIVLTTKGQVSDGIFERQQVLASETDSVVLALTEEFRLVKSQLSKLFVKGAGEEIKNYTDKIDSLSKLAKDLEVRLSRRSASFRKQQDYKHVSVDRVTSSMPEKSVLIEYMKYEYYEVPSDSATPHYLAAVTDPDAGSIIVELGEASQIDALVSEYREHMLKVSSQTHMPTRKDKDEYAMIAPKLYDAVVQPVEECMQGMDLALIAPDGGLNLVSFSGLIDDNGRYLIEKIPVHYLSTGRELIRLKDRSGSGSGLLAFGDPDYDATIAARMDCTVTDLYAQADRDNYTGPVARSGCEYFDGYNLAMLPGTREEIGSIADNWPNESDDPTVTHFGPRASEDVFKAEASGRRVIHLATHGYFMQGQCESSREADQNDATGGTLLENPLLQSGLFFAGANLHSEGADSAGVEDGVLTAYEVSAMNLQGTDMVVLSACETGLGEVRQGEGVYGLRRAFQMAGARTIVSALWRIPDRETASIMSELYAATGETLPEKLRRIQLDCIKELRANQLTDHPYSWAPFIALGDWR
jgi:CHAT domain-containing protein